MGKFQATTTGLVNEICVYSLAAGNVEVAIYQDNAGSSGEIISSAGDAQPVSAGEWNTITFPDTPVTEGTDYWLAVPSDVTGAVVHCSASSGGNGFHWEVIEFDSFVWLDNPAWEGNSKSYNISIAGWGN